MLPRVQTGENPLPGSLAASGGPVHAGAALGVSVLFHFDALGLTSTLRRLDSVKSHLGY